MEPVVLKFVPKLTGVEAPPNLSPDKWLAGEGKSRPIYKWSIQNFVVLKLSGLIFRRSEWISASSHHKSINCMDIGLGRLIII